MCGGIKNRGSFTIGQRVEVIAASGPLWATWQGFAREESLMKYAAWEPVDVPAEAFVEKGQVVPLPKGEIIYGLMYRGHLNLVTREASMAEAEALKHNRVPLTGKPRFKDA